jgi:hypothetical protein
MSVKKTSLALLLTPTLAIANPEITEYACQIRIQEGNAQFTRTYWLMSQELYGDVYTENRLVNDVRVQRNIAGSAVYEKTTAITAVTLFEPELTFIQPTQETILPHQKLFDKLKEQYFGPEGTHVAEDNQCRELYENTHRQGKEKS